MALSNDEDPQTPVGVWPGEDLGVLLRQARATLSGKDSSGRRVHRAMDDPDVISFAHGEGLRRPHPSVVWAGVQALLDQSSAPLERYMFMEHLKELDEAIASNFEAMGIPDQDTGNLCVANGTTPLIWAFLQVFVGSGKSLLVGPGFYHAIAGWCEFLGVQLRLVPTSRGNSLKLTAHDLELWYSNHPGERGNVKALILFNPTPYGAIYTSDELEEIGNFAVGHNLYILDDAIFSGTEYDGVSSPRIAGFHKVRNRVFTINGGSKTYGLANLRIGWGCGPREMIEPIDAYVHAANPTVPEIVKIMALAALNAPTDYLEVNRVELEVRAKLVHSVLNSESNNGLVQPFIIPRAGHCIIAELNCHSKQFALGGFIGHSIDLARFLLDKAAVAVSPGWSCGLPRFMFRLNFASVGQGATYTHSQNEEALYSQGQAAHGFDPDISCPVSHAAPQLAAEFLESRRLIEEGLGKRLLPALIYSLHDRNLGGEYVNI